jgi:hypothetical protein
LDDFADEAALLLFISEGARSGEMSGGGHLDAVGLDGDESSLVVSGGEGSGVVKEGAYVCSMALVVGVGVMRSRALARYPRSLKETLSKMAGVEEEDIEELFVLQTNWLWWGVLAGVVLDAGTNQERDDT